ncbi:MAG: hypothetical protein NVV62_13110 [Terricaulis sp.]|nr:hypothetical protein [Terricaulis sp.]
MPQKSKAPQPGRMLSLIKDVQYAAYVRLESALQPLGVTAMQFRILTTLSNQDLLSSADLGRIYNVKPQTMIKQVVLLERKKLTRRHVAAGNKRVLTVELTARGREVLDACIAEGARLEAEVMQSFSDGERALYRELMIKVLRQLDTLDDAGAPAPAAQWDAEGTLPGVQRPREE